MTPADRLLAQRAPRDSSSPVKSPYTFRLWAAFVIVPFVNAAVAYLCFPLVWAMRGHPGHLADPAEAAFGFALISGVLGLLYVGGRSAARSVARERGPISLPTALVAGLLLGNAPFGAGLIGLVVPATMAHVINGTMSEHLRRCPS